MNTFSAEVTDIVIDSGRKDIGLPDRSIGSILVRPPIQAGEHLPRVIFGTYSRGLYLDAVLSTDEYSLFTASSDRADDPKVREDDVHVIANRIVHLANNPGLAAEMLTKMPFPPLPGDTIGD